MWLSEVRGWGEDWDESSQKAQTFSYKVVTIH